MSRARIGVLTLVLLLWCQPLSYAQNSKGGAEPGQSVGSTPDLSGLLARTQSALDKWGNLLLFKTVLSSKPFNVATHVTLIYPDAGPPSAAKYPGNFSSIAAGDQAVYAIVAVPGTITSANAVSLPLSLVALVTGSTDPLPNAPLPEYPLRGIVEHLRIVPGDDSDLIYVVQATSLARFVLILEFNGKEFKTIGTVPLY